ncbi:MAG: cell filamentation protein Fic, partial [Chlorobiales bacterium]|nr:cell filamentation protein Fic [Chlorobiales bacterium]
MTKRQDETSGEIIIYEAGSGQPRIEVRVENETVWLTQDKIAELFGVKRPAITKHLKNIFESGELVEKEVSSILEHTTRHGAMKGKTQTARSKLYNLDAIISIGYRVNSAT